MNQPQPKNPLHGITLKAILEYLVAEYGWERLSERIKIQCFTENPSINSSLKFLRKTDWARQKVETLYVYSISYDKRHAKKKTPADEQPKVLSNVWEQARKNKQTRLSKPVENEPAENESLESEQADDVPKTPEDE